MMHVGHALLGSHSEVLSIDDGFCSILETRADALVGRSVLDVTAPADRLTCQTLMRRLRATGQPFRVVKRFIKGNGRTVWVTNSVSIIALGDTEMLVSNIVPVAPAAAEPGPAQLLECARLLLASRQERRTVFATQVFGDPAWDMMLAAYVTEAEGGVLDLDTLARAANVPAASAGRWTRALEGEGLIELESHGGTRPHCLFRLTASAHHQFETYLEGLLTTDTALDVSP